MAGLIMVASACSAAAVENEQRGPTPPDRIALPGVYPHLPGLSAWKLASAGWVKYCADHNGQQLCNTYRSRYDGPFGARVDVAIAVAVVTGSGQSTPVIGVFMSRVRLYPAPNIYSAPGITIDDQERLAARNVTCVYNTCGLTFDVTAEFLSKLRSGDILTVVATDHVGRPFRRSISLNGFGVAYDGAPLDPNVLAERYGGTQ